MKKFRLSPSKVNAILQCPYRFNHGDYIESEYMQTGTEIHKEIETLLRKDIDFGRVELKEQYPFLTFLKNINGHGIEDKIEIQLNDEAVAVGVIDYWERNEDTVHIIDWKTGWVISDSDVQPLFYAFLLAASGKWTSGNAIIHIAYLARNISKTFIYEDINDVVKRLNSKIELALKYKEADTRIPNKYCSYCQYRYKCIVAPDAEDYPEDIVEAVQKLKQAKDYVKQLDSLIKHRAETEADNDNLPEEIKLKTRKTERVSAKKAVSYLLDMGVNKELLPSTVDITWLRKHQEYYDVLKRNGLISESSSTEVVIK